MVAAAAASFNNGPSLGSARVDIFGLDQVGPGPIESAIRDDRLEVISLKKTIRYE